MGTGSVDTSAADLLAGVLVRMLRVFGRARRRRLIERMHAALFLPGFKLEGIEYRADPCSVGLTPHGQITGRSAADMVLERDLSDLRVLDLCCGVGIVGLTMAVRLRETRRIRKLSFADINVFNISSVRKTLARNRRALEGLETEVFLSDGLRHIPATKQFDLIISNPPHFRAQSFSEVDLDPGVLGSFDEDWNFHRAFYRDCGAYLSERGEVWFLENHRTSPEKEIRAIVEQSPDVALVRTFDDARDPNVFWMVSRKVQD